MSGVPLWSVYQQVLLVFFFLPCICDYVSKMTVNKWRFSLTQSAFRFIFYLCTVSDGVFVIFQRGLAGGIQHQFLSTTHTPPLFPKKIKEEKKKKHNFHHRNVNKTIRDLVPPHSSNSQKIKQLHLINFISPPFSWFPPKAIPAYCRLHTSSADTLYMRCILLRTFPTESRS